MAKVYAFNPPVSQPADRSDLGDKSISRTGMGTYYGALGMRNTDVDKRLRMHQMTGKSYLETKAAYNVQKDKMKAK